MSRIETAIRTRLLADTAITDIVGDRITLNILPQDPVYPAITFEVMPGTGSEHSMDGASGHSRPRVRVTSWNDDDHGGADVILSLQEDIRKAFQGLIGTVAGVRLQGGIFQGKTSLFDDNLTAHSIVSEFEVPFDEIKP